MEKSNGSIMKLRVLRICCDMAFGILSFPCPSATSGTATPNKNFCHLKYNPKAHADQFPIATWGFDDEHFLPSGNKLQLLPEEVPLRLRANDIKNEAVWLIVRLFGLDQALWYEWNCLIWERKWFKSDVAVHKGNQTVGDAYSLAVLHAAFNWYYC